MGAGGDVGDGAHGHLKHHGGGYGLQRPDSGKKQQRTSFLLHA